MQRIVVWGAGRVARGCLGIIKSLAAGGTPVECIGFMVDPQYKKSSTLHGLPVHSDLKLLAAEPDVAVIVGIGSSAARQRVARRIEREFGPRFAQLVHPLSLVGENVSIGPGTVLYPGLLGETEISIGAHVRLNHHVHLGHDNVVGDFVTVAPGGSFGGGVEMGEGADFGLGVTVIPEVKVGRWTIIGAGTVITKDVPDNTTVVGVPACVVAEREPGWHLEG